MDIETLKKDKDIFFAYAIKNYGRLDAYCTKDFGTDIRRFYSINRAFRSLKNEGKINLRQQVNNIIILGNVFGIGAAVNMILAKTDEVHYDCIKPIFMYLNYLKETDHRLDSIIMNDFIIRELRKDEFSR